MIIFVPHIHTMLTKTIQLLLITLICSCASIQSPTGGPEDTTPPVCLKKVPADKTIQFKSKSITFTFDEYVILNDVINQFLISPPLKENPDIKLKGKKVTVTFNEELKPNTTYTLNFGNGIKDNNNNNTLEGLSYTFSTGDFIDSISIKGKVLDAFTLLPQKDIIIGLYKITNDSTIFKEKPYYISKPTEDGIFKINYLSPGDYLLVGFEDVNKNLKIETNEKLAFTDSIFNISYENSDTNKLLQLLLSKQFMPQRPQLINYREVSKGAYQIITSGSNCKLLFDGYGLNKKEDLHIEKQNKNCDTILVYTNNQCEDSVKYKLIIDTVTETVLIPCKSKKYNQFTVNTSLNQQGYNFLNTLTISLSNPYSEIREKDIIFLIDTIPSQDYKIQYDSSTRLSFNIIYPWKEESNYSIKFPKGTIKDVFEQEIDSFQLFIKTAAASSFGNLSIIVSNHDSSNYIVQLLDKDLNVIKEETINQPKAITYGNLKPGQYFVKVINDENKNGKWDEADYFSKKQAEKVFVTLQSMEVRANWEIADITIDPGL